MVTENVEMPFPSKHKILSKNMHFWITFCITEIIQSYYCSLSCHVEKLGWSFKMVRSQWILRAFSTRTTPADGSFYRSSQRKSLIRKGSSQTVSLEWSLQAGLIVHCPVIFPICKAGVWLVTRYLTFPIRAANIFQPARVAKTTRKSYYFETLLAHNHLALVTLALEPQSQVFCFFYDIPIYK